MTYEKMVALLFGRDCARSTKRIEKKYIVDISLHRNTG